MELQPGRRFKGCKNRRFTPVFSGWSLVSSTSRADDCRASHETTGWLPFSATSGSCFLLHAGFSYIRGNKSIRGRFSCTAKSMVHLHQIKPNPHSHTHRHTAAAAAAQRTSRAHDGRFFKQTGTNLKPVELRRGTSPAAKPSTFHLTKCFRYFMSRSDLSNALYGEKTENWMNKRRAATREKLNICWTLRGCSVTVGTVDVEVVAEECGLAVWTIGSFALLVIHYIHSK